MIRAGPFSGVASESVFHTCFHKQIVRNMKTDPAPRRARKEEAENRSTWESQNRVIPMGRPTIDSHTRFPRAAGA